MNYFGYFVSTSAKVYAFALRLLTQKGDFYEQQNYKAVLRAKARKTTKIITFLPKLRAKAQTLIHNLNNYIVFQN